MLNVVNHQPTKQIELAWQGAPSRRVLTRILLTLFLLPFWVMPILMGMLFVAGAAKDPDISAAGAAGLAVAAAVFMLIWYPFVGFFTYLASLACHVCVRLEANSLADELVVEIAGWWLLGRKRYRIPLTQVQELGFTIQGQQQILLHGKWRDANGAERNLPQVQLYVSGLDSRAKAIDLIFRLADAAGWWFYHIPRSDHLRVQLELLQDEDAHPHAQPVPGFGERREGVDYAATAGGELPENSPGHEAGVAAATQVQVANFDPQQFAFDWEKMCGREVTWEPGRHIRIYRPPIKHNAVIAIGIFVGAVGSIGVSIGAGLVFGLQWSVLGLVPGAALGVTAALLVRHFYREREVVFDWPAGEARFTDGGRERRASFTSLRQIILRCKTRERSSGGPDSRTHYTVYGCEVVIESDQGSEQVALSIFERSKDAVYQMTAPLAAELAEALRVPWQWVDVK